MKDEVTNPELKFPFTRWTPCLCKILPAGAQPANKPRSKLCHGCSKASTMLNPTPLRAGMIGQRRAPPHSAFEEETPPGLATIPSAGLPPRGGSVWDNRRVPPPSVFDVPADPPPRSRPGLGASPSFQPKAEAPQSICEPSRGQTCQQMSDCGVYRMEEEGTASIRAPGAKHWASALVRAVSVPRCLGVYTSFQHKAGPLRACVSPKKALRAGVRVWSGAPVVEQ